MPLVLIDRTLGTNIGDMTGSGGLAAAFDGSTNQAYSAGAATPGNATSGWIGKTLAKPWIFGRAIMHGSNNHGFKGNSNPTITLNLRGKNGAAPGSRTDGTLVATMNFTDTGNESAGRQADSTDLLTAWDHLFLELLGSGGTGGLSCAELILYAFVPSARIRHHYRTMAP